MSCDTLSMSRAYNHVALVKRGEVVLVLALSRSRPSPRPSRGVLEDPRGKMRFDILSRLDVAR